MHKTVVYGKEYKSIKIACAQLNVPYESIIIAKRKAKEDPGKVIEEYIERHNNRKLKYQDILHEHGYKTMAELCRDVNMHKATIIYRLDKGLSFKEAISHDTQYKSTVVFGEVYGTQVDACRAYGALRTTISYRADKKGIPFGKALEEYIKEKKLKKIIK